MLRRFLKLLCFLGVLLGLGGAVVIPMTAHAQGADARLEFLSTTQRWLDDAVAGLSSSELGPLRIEVVIGELDSRLKLAPCARVEPYIPPGTRLWGKTRLGLRCLEGASRWNVFLPVTIRAFGTAWVIKGNVPAGAVMTESDAMEAEVDWAAESSPVMSNTSQWVGQVAGRPLVTGEALRQGMIRPAQVFQAGAQIRVMAHGAGFEISADGQAMSTGVVGQSARVKMGNGRVTSGIVIDSRTVKLSI